MSAGRDTRSGENRARTAALHLDSNCLRDVSTALASLSIRRGGFCPARLAAPCFTDFREGLLHRNPLHRIEQESSGPETMRRVARRRITSSNRELKNMKTTSFAGRLLGSTSLVVLSAAAILGAQQPAAAQT